MRTRKKSYLSALICLALLLSVFGGPSPAQEKKEAPEKLLAEIVGNFEFEYQGEYIVFVFSVKDGNLTGGPEGEAPEVLKPVEGEEMAFVGFSPEGMELKFKFARDDEGKLTKCTIAAPSMGLEVEGKRIKG